MSEKQVAMLMATICLVLATLAGTGIVLSVHAIDSISAAEQKLQMLQDKVDQQQMMLGQVATGLLSLAPKVSDTLVDELADHYQANKKAASNLLAAPADEQATQESGAADSSGGAGAVQAQKPAVKAAQAPAPAVADNGPLESVDDILAQRIIANWKRPPSAKNGMTVDIIIRINRQGEVREAVVVKSSGDTAFDTSATDAIMAVDSIPEMARVSDKTFNEMYKERRVRFRPEDLAG